MKSKTFEAVEVDTSIKMHSTRAHLTAITVTDRRKKGRKKIGYYLCHTENV